MSVGFIVIQKSLCSLRCCQLLVFCPMALGNGVGAADECIMLWGKEQDALKAWNNNLKLCCFDLWVKSVWLGLCMTSISSPAKGSEFILSIPAWKFTWKAENSPSEKQSCELHVHQQRIVQHSLTAAFFKGSIEILMALIQCSHCNSCCFAVIKNAVFGGNSYCWSAHCSYYAWL